jgi:hypothetical protein
VNRYDTPPSEEFVMDDSPMSITDFPQESRESVTGLLWLGFLEETVDVFGHEFVVRTLRVGEDLQVGLLTKEYADSLGQEQAIATATVALALKSVDGDPDFCPQVSKSADHAKQRFQYVQNNWYMPVIFKVFDAYLGLLDRQNDALQRVEDLSQRSLNTFMPSPDSLIEKGDLEEQPVNQPSSEEMADIADLASFNED